MYLPPVASGGRLHNAKRFGGLFGVILCPKTLPTGVIVCVYVRDDDRTTSSHGRALWHTERAYNNAYTNTS